MRTCLRVAGAVVLCVSASCAAQQAALPDGPVPKATLVGTVEDGAGGLLPGARVEVVSSGGTAVAFADEDGEFRAYGVIAGTFTLRITAAGFFALTQTGTVAPGEEKTLEPVELRASGDTSNITVTATQHDIAAAQVAMEEKQRVLGIIPNFYVVYDKNPAPLSKGQKFHLAWRSTLDPFSFVGAGIAAGIGQASNQYSGYGQGTSGYAKRYGAAFADGAVATFLGGAILPTIFHQDPRYRYQGTGTVGSRLKHAAASVVTARSDKDNKLRFNYSNVIGNFASAGLSNLYYPASDRNGAGLTLSNAAIGTAFGVFGAIMQEFVVPKFTPKLPMHEKP